MPITFSNLITLGGFTAVVPPQPVTDPYFNLTTLLLPGNGTNNATNNTFLDSSVNNYTITRFGNTTQGTFSPYGTLWSNYFDGTGDYLTIATNAAFGYGTSDFTIEGWFYFNTVTAQQTVFSNLTSAASVNPHLYINSTASAIYYATGGVDRITSSALVANTWYHIALARSGSSTKLFVNGVQAGSTYTDTNDYGATAPAGIGTYFSAGVPVTTSTLNGYASNTRVVKGAALYTANFTPPTTPLAAVAGTSLLTCADNRFVDDSTNNFAITRTGNVLVTNFSPFINDQAYSAAADGGCMYLDGTGDYLTAPASTNFQFPGDFTIEGWMYFTNTAKASPQALISVKSGATEFDVRWFTTRWQVSLNAGTGTNIGTTPAPVNNAWTHVACVRSGSSINLYVNGVKTATTLTSSATLGQTAQPMAIGSATGASNIFTGYLSNVRVIKGQALYTSNFVPPQTPLLPVTDTVLLVNGTNAAIADATTKTVSETVADAKISTVASKFGGSSMSFDGTGDYLKIPTSADLDFGTGDFTIETWVNFNALTTNRLLLDRWASANANSWQLYWRATGTSMTFLVGNATVLLQDPNASNIVAGTWNHVAVTRSGTTARLFVNGIVVATATSSLSLSSTISLGIGAQASTSTNFLNGYLQDVRITKGFARYTENFTLPTTAFPLY